MADGTQQDKQEYQQLLSRAEEVLKEGWGREVHIGRFERLSEPQGRNLVLRCEVTGAPADAPPSVILKQARQRNYDPDDPKSRPAVGLFRDWAGLKFLDSLQDERLTCAKVYGGDRGAGFFVMEDLRGTVDLDHLLTCSSADEASHGLRMLAATLGRMHAVTIGHAGEYQKIRDALGPGDSAHRHRLAKHARDYGPYLAERCERLGVQHVPGYRDDIEKICSAIAEPGDFLAFTHCDACPDNCRISDQRLCLIDFEFASYRHALLDGVYGWIRFPTCWCARDLPGSVVTEMEEFYRRELAHGCEAAADDTLYFRAVAEACGYWLLENMAHLFDRALQYETPKGTSTNRQRILMRMAAFCEVAERSGHLPALQQTVDGLLERVRQLWRVEMPLYDAFGHTFPVTSDETAEFVAAIQAEDAGRVRELLHRNRGLAGAKVRDEDQTPVLYLAMQTKNRDLVTLLLDHGADWRQTTRSGWTILSRACSHGSPEIVDLLRERGADLNRRDSWGMLPIYGVVSSGNAAMLEHLLACGARPDVKLAIELKQLGLARELLKQDPSRARMRFGTGITLLHDAARLGESRWDAMQLLVEFGADVNAQTNWGATPLHLAAFYGRGSSVRLLLKHGADPTVEDKRGRTSLMLAQGRGHVECVHLLGGTVGEQPSEQCSPLTIPNDDADLIDDVFAAFGASWNDDPHPLDDLDAKFGTWFNN